MSSSMTLFPSVLRDLWALSLHHRVSRPQAAGLRRGNSVGELEWLTSRGVYCSKLGWELVRIGSIGVIRVAPTFPIENTEG